MIDRPPVPLYGTASLAELIPSVMDALGVPGLRNALGFEPLTGACVLLVDGLGWQGLRVSRTVAPFLWEAAKDSTPLTAGFPATTTTSLGSLGTGLPPGEHGLVGYSFAVPGHDRAMNALRWELYGTGPSVDLRQEFPPERFQPHPTLFERAAAEGVGVVLLGPPHLARSPLERAVLRGGRYHGVHSLGDLAAAIPWRTGTATGRRFVYAYHPGLDTTGHVRGVASEAWALELANVDRLVEAVVERLPPDTALIVTGDHGMVDIEEDSRLDLVDHPALASGVRLLAGEGRARHVHALPGAEADVLAAWQAVVGDRMWVVSGDQAVSEGWFGPQVSDGMRSRIGEIVVAARAAVGVYQREVDPLQAGLIGHHGSMTAAEQLVPCLVFRA
jgi:hypothetical protein